MYREKKKKYIYRMVNPQNVKRRQSDGWERGCSLEEKKKYGNKRYMGTEDVLMKKEVA
jgi:hypothetical protein